MTDTYWRTEEDFDSTSVLSLFVTTRSLLIFFGIMKYP